jgi:hypothetical protein
VHETPLSTFCALTVFGAAGTDQFVPFHVSARVVVLVPEPVVYPTAIQNDRVAHEMAVSVLFSTPDRGDAYHCLPSQYSVSDGPPAPPGLPTAKQNCESTHETPLSRPVDSVAMVGVAAPEGPGMKAKKGFGVALHEVGEASAAVTATASSANTVTRLSRAALTRA